MKELIKVKGYSKDSYYYGWIPSKNKYIKFETEDAYKDYFFEFELETN